AGKRVGRYLLMQLVVNIVYAVPIAIGLWLLGIPNPLLWGLLALALRFVPYIGPVIATLLPLFLALAVAPGWSLVLWTAGLFVVVELITGNVIEPWLYG
ncbi:MAG: AI-2E family transporter, partial [Mesorhizobium sp.]